MNGRYNKLEKLERKSPLYGRAKVNTQEESTAAAYDNKIYWRK